MNPRHTFDQELEALHIELIRMGGLAEEAIGESISAFRNHDKVLANAIIRGDDQIDDMEKRIESRCLNLILRQQPVAGDLRKISAALKMVTDIERIADHAADIAEISMQINGEYIIDLVQHIPGMAEAAAGMVHEAIDAFVNADLEAAERIIGEDDIVDELFCQVKADLAETLKQDKDMFNNSIDFLLIAKYLERIADHAVNICEWVLFSETGIHKDKKIM